jgi:hypothetical protein
MDARKPIDPKKKERYAELIGLGLSHPEAAGATGVSERSGERLMAEPGYRKIAEEARRGRGMQGEVAQVVRDMLAAVRPDGRPDLAIRQKGVEAYMKNPELIDAEDEAELLPYGVIEVYPVPPSVRAALDAYDAEERKRRAEFEYVPSAFDPERWFPEIAPKPPIPADQVEDAAPVPPSPTEQF